MIVAAKVSQKAEGGDMEVEAKDEMDNIKRDA